MATRSSVLIALVLVAAQSCSAQFWRQQNGYYQNRYPQQQSYPNYNQQRPYQQQQQQGNNGFQLPPGVSVSEAEWVCKNPKTGDMMIITSENTPVNNGNNGQWPRPPTNNQPTYPQTQPTYPQTQPTYPQTQPSYPQTQPNYPQTQPPSPNYPTVNQGQPNSNGEGLIDIRLGEPSK